jgi:hypothetical protein
MERLRSVTPSPGRVTQGVDLQNDGITDIFRIQNTSPNVGEDDNLHQKEGRGLLYSEVVLESFPPEEVKKLDDPLIEYIKDEVPIEKWEEEVPDRTIHLVRRLLKARDDVTTQGMRNYLLVLDKEYRSQRITQEIIGTLEEFG